MGEKDVRTMQTEITIQGTRRDAQGKGAARRLRASGKLPAIVYGPGTAPTTIAVDPKEVVRVLHTSHGRNTVVTLVLDGKPELAMLKSFDHHPLTRDIEHADFYRVALDRAIIVEVPFHAVGKAKGVAEGGVMRLIYRKLAVKCTPEKIPVQLEIDVSDLALGEGHQVRDLKLPDGVVVMLDPGQTVVAVVAPEKEEKVETTTPTGEAAAAGGGPAAAGAAPGAGAAGGKAPAGAAAAPAAAGGKGAAPAKAAAPAKDAKKK